MTVNEAAEQLRYNLAGEIDADSNLTLLDAALAHERSAAVAAFVWERLEGSPGFNEEMAQALADVKAGRVTAWSEVKARLDEEGYVAPDLTERSAGAAPDLSHWIHHDPKCAWHRSDPKGCDCGLAKVWGGEPVAHKRSAGADR